MDRLPKRVDVLTLRPTLTTNGECGVLNVRRILLILRIRLTSTTLINVHASNVVQGTRDCPCDALKANALARRLRSPNLFEVTSNGNLATEIMAMNVNGNNRRLSDLADHLATLRDCVSR